MNADAPTSDGTAGPESTTAASSSRRPGGSPWPEGSFVAQLSTDAREALFQAGTVRQFAAGERLLTQGDDSTHVMVIRQGLVKIVSSAENGHTTLLAIRTLGDIVGELGALDNRPRSATVFAVRNVVVTVIAGQAFKEVCRREPQVSLVLMRIVTNRLRAATQARIDLGGYSLKVRLARTLVSLAGTYGVAQEKGVRIGVPLSNDDLASLIGSSPVSLHRALRTLRDDGVINTGYRSLVITDLPGLTRIAEG
ncbi:Crp/Fnr family transcriptional regulator [Streptomyces sp. NPDC004838]